MLYDNEAPDTAPALDKPRAKRKSVSRRSFLQIMGIAGATTAAISQVNVARAGNGWTLGLEEVPNEKLIDMYTTMLKSRWWEEMMKETFLAGKDCL